MVKDGLCGVVGATLGTRFPEVLGNNPANALREHCVCVNYSKVLQQEEAAVPQDMLQWNHRVPIGCVLSGMRVRVLQRTHGTVAKEFEHT